MMCCGGGEEEETGGPPANQYQAPPRTGIPSAGNSQMKYALLRVEMKDV